MSLKQIETGQMDQSEAADIVPAGRLWLIVLLAIVVATTANVIFYFILTGLLGVGLMFPSQTPARELAPMPVYDVIVFSIIFSSAAGVVFVLVSHFARRPIKTFLIISVVVLFLSFAMPLKIPSPPVAMVDKLSLVMMHVVGAIAVVGVLVGLSRK